MARFYAPVWNNRTMIRKGIKQLIAEAELRSRGISVEEAKKRIGDGNTVFVDIRDVRELEREGMIPGAFHAPRGMLEFWVDPESPYYKSVFTEDKTFIVYCQADWRGTLAAATLGDMGDRRKAGAPTAPKPEKKKT